MVALKLAMDPNLPQAGSGLNQNEFQSVHSFVTMSFRKDLGQVTGKLQQGFLFFVFVFGVSSWT